MALQRTEIPKLGMCRACGYVACICPVLKGHVEGCTRRRAILDTSPKECAQHRRVACADCWPCDCAAAVKPEAAE